MAADEPVPPEVKEFFSRIGKKYGALGGKAASANLSPAQRKKRAKMMGDARQEVTTAEQRSAAQKPPPVGHKLLPWSSLDFFG